MTGVGDSLLDLQGSGNARTGLLSRFSRPDAMAFSISQHPAVPENIHSLACEPVHRPPSSPAFGERGPLQYESRPEQRLIYPRHRSLCVNILFLCNQGKNRSRTAAELFRGPFQTDSAGLYCHKPVTARQVAWADVIIVMEDRHRTEIAKRFPALYLRKRILTLGIPDLYYRGQPELLQQLTAAMGRLL